VFFYVKEFLLAQKSEPVRGARGEAVCGTGRLKSDEQKGGGGVEQGRRRMGVWTSASGNDEATSEKR